MIVRKVEADLVTRNPCCCTSWGSRGVAWANLFCTWTCAMSASVPCSKVRVMFRLPAESLLDEK